MTAKERSDYEAGKAYGYRHPNKVMGWFQSEAWNAGMKAGQAEYWKDQKKRPRRITREQLDYRWKKHIEQMEKKNRKRNRPTR